MSDQDWDMGEKPATAVTIEEFDGICATIYKLRNDKAELEARVKILNSELALQEGKALEYMVELGKDKYAAADVTLSVQKKLSWKVPQTDEARAAFFDHLKALGAYDRMVSVHSGTLQSFCNAEFETAKQEGRTVEIPGIDEPTYYERLSVRRK